MSFSEETQAARKTAQLARLAAKGTPGYLELFASQPEQLRKAAIYKAERKAYHDSKQAANSQALADAKGSAETFGNIATKKGEK